MHLYSSGKLVYSFLILRVGWHAGADLARAWVNWSWPWRRGFPYASWRSGEWRLGPDGWWGRRPVDPLTPCRVDAATVRMDVLEEESFVLSLLPLMLWLDIHGVPVTTEILWTTSTRSLKTQKRINSPTHLYLMNIFLW